MKENELRIGNFIQCYRLPIDKEKTHHKIKGVFYSEPYNCYCVALEDGFIINVNKGIEPIKLTEDWLKKEPYKIKEWKGNGYDYQPETSKTKQKYYLLSEDVFLVFETWSYRKTEEDEWINEESVFINYYDAQIFPKEKVVHCFQNLYFALTGLELHTGA